nr:MAG TPA: hypothetical protein [Caudoviricetes sp.]
MSHFTVSQLVFKCRNTLHLKHEGKPQELLTKEP